MKPKSLKKFRSCALLLVCLLSLASPCLLQADCQVYNGIYNDINGRYITYNSNITASNYEYYSYSGIVDLSGFQSATTIDSYAFYKCDVTNVRISNNVSFIGCKAFSNCNNLKRVLLESPSCTFYSYGSSYNYPFYGTTCKMYVPEGTGEYYRSKTIGGNVTIIDSFTVSGRSFSGSGSGTKDDPYLIFNPIQLNQIRNFLDEKYVHFKLMSDIDLSDWIADNNPSQGWQPIGTPSSPFMGIFDGNNHRITGFRINRSTNDNIGFFGYMLWAQISNLTIEGGGVYGNNYVGALAGQAVSSSIDNCRATLLITSSNNHIGGLIGCGSGNMTGCISNVEISGNDCIGGLVGSSFDGQGSDMHFDNCTFDGVISGANNIAPCMGYSNHNLFITNFRSMGDVASMGDNVGGVLGYSCGGIMDISQSYSLCDINCNGNYAGGITGFCQSMNTSTNTTYNNFIINSIVDSYYNGSIKTDGAYTGGIIGYSNYNKTSVYQTGIVINRCYSNAFLTGGSYVGGIAGYTPGAIISSNVSICKLISAVTSNVGRIYGSDDLEKVTIGENGTAEENKGLATSSVMLNGVQLELPDGLKHGTNVGSATLKYKATYQGMGWDFDDWTIVETESYPYKLVQCAPPIITSILEAKATEVSGNSIDDGTVTVITSGKKYLAQTSDHYWSVPVDPLQAGALVKVQADIEEKLPSYFELQTVGFGGSGTEENPYSIYTAEDLQNINSYKYYRLMADIDLTEWINDNNPSNGWIPIGASGNATMKQLDGNGHKITGLWCDNNLENCGLFATTNNATICDLEVYTANEKKVKGGTNTGIIVGYAEGTLFENITVNGCVEGSYDVGGIVGHGKSDTSIKFSLMNGIVTGYHYVGGLSGNSAIHIQECYSQGTVTGKGTTCYVGGIAGFNRFVIENSYSSANVIAGEVDSSIPSSNLNQYAGGIVGNNGHTVNNCYATGNLFAVKCAAGISGYNTTSASTVNRCYAMNHKIEVADVSGIAMRVIGGIRNGAPTPEANNYALKTMAVSVNNIPQTIYDDLLHGLSLTEVQLKKETTYHDNGWDMDNVWNIIENETYPYLRFVQVPHDEPVGFIRGDVNQDDNVNISDVTALIDYLLSGDSTNITLVGSDVNQDGNVNISDVTALIDYLLSGHWSDM